MGYLNYGSVGILYTMIIYSVLLSIHICTRTTYPVRVCMDVCMDGWMDGW